MIERVNDYPGKAIETLVTRSQASYQTGLEILPPGYLPIRANPLETFYSDIAPTGV